MNIEKAPPERQWLRTKQLPVDQYGRVVELYDDGYRIFAKWISVQPVNGPSEPELVMEYKHCDFPALADAAIDALMGSADRASSPAAEAKCVKCGHNRFAGTCMEQVPFKDATGNGVYVCGCHCEFPTATPKAEIETGWLLEKMSDGQIWYITVDQLLTWTTDPLKALRLARRADAELLSNLIDDCERIEEHQWG